VGWAARPEVNCAGVVGLKLTTTGVWAGQHAQRLIVLVSWVSS